MVSAKARTDTPIKIPTTEEIILVAKNYTPPKRLDLAAYE
jgi:hypothetical protein